MNIPSQQEELYVSGFDPGFRVRDRDDAVSLAKSMDMSDQGLVVGNKKANVTAGKSSPTSTGSSTLDGAIEVDFYRNPTVLSRMILYNKFSNASKRCRDSPEEASVWVCAKRKSNATKKSPIHSIFERSQSVKRVSTSTPQTQKHEEESTEYSMRQLPIHLACTSLAFAHDSLQRTELEQLIVRLVVTYPQGCGEFDHGGRLPLHEAIWSASSAETISMLLMASPRSIDRRDKFGRTPMELNQRRSCALGNSPGLKLKEEIRDMLKLGAPYWERARDEARFRMKLAVVPLSGVSVSSTQVLGSSLAGKETLMTADAGTASSRWPHKQPQRSQIQSEDITPISWEQLERRCLFLEQLLSEMFEKNYELAGAVEELKKAKKAVEAKLELARAQQTSQQKSGTIAATRSRSSVESQSISVDTIPEDDESSIAELIDHVESLVGSYHSSKRHQQTPTPGDRSMISELSTFSSPTLDSSVPGQPVRLNRSNSLVSGLTMSEDSFDPSSYAVKTEYSSNNSKDSDDSPKHDSSNALATDDLSDMFMVAAAKNTAEPSPRRGWTAPISSSSFIPTAAIPMLVEEEDSSLEGLSPSGVSREAGEIYLPGFMVNPAQARVDSTLSITASSIETSSSDGTQMSESTEETNEDGVTADEESKDTMSTPARFVEDMVFGGTDDHSRSGSASPVDPARYNYDIQIPALDTYYGPDSGEI